MAPSHDEWGQECTIQLFNFIKDRECIWNPDYPDNTPLKITKAWNEVLCEMQEIDPQLTLFDVKLKYFRFKSQYIRHVRKYELTGKKPKSFLCNLLNFIPIQPKGKPINNWSNKQTSKMITLLKPHECLWLKQHPNYHKLDVKEAATKAIYQEIKKYIPTVTLKHVINKIKIIKYSFDNYERRKGRTKFRQTVPWWYAKLSYMKRSILRKNNHFSPDDENKIELVEIEAAEGIEESSGSIMDDDGDDDDDDDNDDDDNDDDVESTDNIIKYRWPKSALIKLIKEIESHECLWLKSSKGDNRDQAAMTILKKLQKNYPNLTMHCLKRKITQMKYSFYKYNSKYETELEYGKPAPWWYTQMEFLKKNLNKNKCNVAIEDSNEVLINEADNDIKEEVLVFEECSAKDLSEIKIEPVLFDYNITSNHCRLCLENNGEINLNDTLANNTNETFIECAERYFQLDHNDTIEDMPKKICTNCANQVIATYELGEKISKSNVHLKHILSNRKYVTNASTIHEDFTETIDDISIVEEKKEQHMEISDEETFIESANENILSIETINVDSLNAENNLELTKQSDLNDVEKVLQEDIDVKCDNENDSVNEKSNDETKRFKDMYFDAEDSDSDIPIKPKQKSCYKGPRLLCHICSQSLINPVSLRKHLLSHDKNRERKFKCEICGLKSFTINRYREHKKIHDPDRVRHQCEFCDKSYCTVSSLNVHRREHTGEMFKCSLCPRSFYTRIALKSHINLHTGSKNFECDFCGEKFVDKSRLSNHKREHYKLKWKCQMCSKEYARRKSLREHMLSHSGYPFQCDICGMGIPSKHKCKNHIMQVHKIDDLEEAMTHIKVLDIEYPKVPSFKEVITPEEIAELSKKLIQNA